MLKRAWKPIAAVALGASGYYVYDAYYSSKRLHRGSFDYLIKVTGPDGQRTTSKLTVPLLTSYGASMLLQAEVNFVLCMLSANMGGGRTRDVLPQFFQRELPRHARCRTAGRRSYNHTTHYPATA